MRARRNAWALLQVALLALLLAAPASAQLGPAPRDAEQRFTNPGGPLSRGGFGVRFPFFLRRIGSSLAERPGAPGRIANDGAFLRANALHSTPTATWIGHSTLLVQMDHVTFLTDPTWSKRASPVSFAGPPRLVAPGVALDDLPPIDFVVVSHNHYDHLDLDTLRVIVAQCFSDAWKHDGAVAELDARSDGEVLVPLAPVQARFVQERLVHANHLLLGGAPLAGGAQAFDGVEEPFLLWFGDAVQGAD